MRIESGDGLAKAFKLVKRDGLDNDTKVLIFSSYEADSVCATLILSSLFQQEFISFAVRPVISVEDLIVKTREELADGNVVSVFFINCGGPIDFKSILNDIPEGITFYLVDSHLPLHLSNVNDEEQVIVFPTDEGMEDQEEEEEDDPMEESSQSQDANANGNASKKRKIGSYFGKSASSMMYELAVETQKESLDLLWLAIVGFTDQFVHQRISDSQYLKGIEYFKKENRSEKFSVDKMQEDKGYGGVITFGYEYKFNLHRHWSLYESMYHSTYIASRLGIWTENGKKKLKTILVNMGVSLEECENRWDSVSVESKDTIRDKIQEASSFYGLNELMYPSFHKNIGMRLQVSACDVVLAVNALLENLNGSHDNFWKAYEALKGNDAHLTDGITEAIQIQKQIVVQGTHIIERGSMTKSGPFRYVYLNDMNECPAFTTPLNLTRLAIFVKEILHEFKVSKSKAPLKGRPLVLCAFDNTSASYLICGLHTRAPSFLDRNKFGMALEQSAAKTGSRIRSHNFEPSIMNILRDDVKKFMENLHHH
eukprot:TRINITY_DN563_c0_g4_i1.p1 TRINITY_DN563_c0_g4~~TRINITY_DN563_c0_g4_i1.p1  ORF type:complete len:539 (-),score=188.81 TRINITY_DN563_c0_g4_i1:20-1636(-)